jgi:hypothetical protein
VIKEKEKAKRDAERQENDQTLQRRSGGRGGSRGDMTPEMIEQIRAMRQNGQLDTAALRKLRQARKNNQQEGQRDSDTRSRNTVQPDTQKMSTRQSTRQ